MATPIFVCGAECGVITSSGTPTHFEIVAGTGTVSTGTVRSGSRSFRCNPSAAGGITIGTRPTSSTRRVGRFYVRFATLPSADSWIANGENLAAGSDSSGPNVAFKQSDSKIYAAVGTTLGASGVSVTTGVWYRIDFDFNINTGGNDTCDVQVDGSACGQATAAGLGAASARFQMGVNGSGTRTADAFFDDIILSSTGADYPLGAGYVNHFVPTSDGTHNIAGTGDFQRGNTGTDILNSTTTAFQLVDDVPLPSGTVDEADNQRAVAPPNATDYVECVFGPASGISTPTAGPRGVHVFLVHHQISTASGNIRVAINDNGSLDDVLNLTAAGVVTYQYAGKHYSDPPSAASAWTATSGNGNFNNLRYRFFSSDAAPDQCLDAIMVEAEFAETAVTATPSAGSLALSGVAPLMAFTFGMTAGALALTGQAPSAAVTIPVNPDVGSLTLTGQAPTLQINVIAAPDTGQLVLNGQAVALSTDLALPTGSLALTGAAPTLQIDVPMFPASGALALAGQTPTLNAGVAVAAGALAFTGNAPSLQIDVPMFPAAGALALAGQTPTLDSGMAVAAGTLTFTGTEPVLAYAILPASGALVLEGQAPTLDVQQGAVTRSPGTGELTFTGYAPALFAGTLVQPDAGTLTLTGQEVTLKTDVAVAVGALTLTGAAPTVAVDAPMFPAAGALTLSGQAPALSIGHVVAPAVVTLNLTGQAPTLRYDLAVTPAAGALTFTGHAPQLFEGSLCQPASGALTLTGHAPTLRFDLIATPTVGALTLTGQTPVASLGFLTTPATGALTLTGETPNLTVGFVASPDAGALTFTGNAPTLGMDVLAEPAAGVLTFTGHAPTLQVAAGTVVIEVPSGALTLTGQAPFEYGLFVVFVATDEAIARDATITTTAQRQSRLLTTADRDAQITS